jgi:hypothetical protein
MTEPCPAPASAPGSESAFPADAAHAGPDPAAISPALGPLPAIYVLPPGQPGPVGPPGRAAARVARLLLRWATRQQRRNDVRHPR